MKHADYSCMNQSNSYRTIQFWIDYNYDFGKNESIDVKVELYYSRFAKSWLVDSLNFPNLNKYRITEG